jgi:drug/metabolite transporter (DMT)-like permease
MAIPSDEIMSDPSTTEANRDTRNDYDVLNTDAMQWISALVALIGLYVVASPFIFESTEAAIWNDTLTGTAIFLLAGYNFVRLSRDRLASVGIASLTVLLGLWLLISPTVIEMGSDTLATGTAVSGLSTAVLSAYNAYKNKKADTTEHTSTHAHA